MERPRRSYLVTALVLLFTFLSVVFAMAGTVKIQTSTGAGASATYYTESGDWATGDATVSPNGSVDLATNGSVQMGLVRGGSGPGSGSFAPFSGDFSASASSSGGASAASTNPRADIFVVTQTGNSTVGNYTIDGVPGTTYGTIGAAVGAATGGGDGANPDWILVDQGTYDERVDIDAFESNSALTSAWALPMALHPQAQAITCGGTAQALFGRLSSPLRPHRSHYHRRGEYEEDSLCLYFRADGLSGSSACLFPRPHLLS